MKMKVFGIALVRPLGFIVRGRQQTLGNAVITGTNTNGCSWPETAPGAIRLEFNSEMPGR